MPDHLCGWISVQVCITAKFNNAGCYQGILSVRRLRWLHLLSQSVVVWRGFGQ